jgi:membrane fusion protein, multidrug efflux system
MFSNKHTLPANASGRSLAVAARNATLPAATRLRSWFCAALSARNRDRKGVPLGLRPINEHENHAVCMHPANTWRGVTFDGAAPGPAAHGVTFNGADARSVMALGLAAFLLTLTACGQKEEHRAAAAPPPPVAVTVVAAAPAEWPGYYEAVGSVRARSTAVLQSKVMGYVREVSVNVGDTVRAGQTLAVIDSRDLDAQWRQAQAALGEARAAQPEVDSAIAQAKAQLGLTEVTFRRLKDLFEKKSISNQEYDEAQARMRVAQAGYDMALARRQQLLSKVRQAEEAVNAAAVMRGYTDIQAPFAGVVIEKRIEPGNLAAPGAPLVTIERAGGYRLEVAVEETRLSGVRVGQTVGVRLDAFPQDLSGRVSEIVPAIDSAARAFTVKIDLPAVANLRSGLFGRARFAELPRQVLVIPAGAVRQQGQVQSVFVAEAGQARGRLVSLGTRRGDQVEALSGITAGDKIVCPIPDALADGARVEVRP